MFAEDDLRPISALQHLLFCERQCALIHIEQLWAENSLTLTGRHLHEKVDAGRSQRRKQLQTTRSLPLRSLTLGIYGKADVVEFHDQLDIANNLTTGVADSSAMSSSSFANSKKSIPFPVEYKRGKPKKNRCDEVQLCAQALCLEEMLDVPVPAGAIFYGLTRRRLDVPFNASLRALTLHTIARLHEMLGSGITPRADYDSKKCDRCSLFNLCVPKAKSSASTYLNRQIALLVAADG